MITAGHSLRHETMLAVCHVCTQLLSTLHHVMVSRTIPLTNISSISSSIPLISFDYHAPLPSHDTIHQTFIQIYVRMLTLCQHMIQGKQQTQQQQLEQYNMALATMVKWEPTVAMDMCKFMYAVYDSCHVICHVTNKQRSCFVGMLTFCVMARLASCHMLFRSYSLCSSQWHHTFSHIVWHVTT